MTAPAPHKIQEDALVLGQEEVAHQTYRLRLESPRISRKARAGQFTMLQVRDGADPLLRRPFSFHRIHAGEGAIEILYRVVGKGTWWLSKTPAGSTVNLIGPLGNGFHTAADEAAPAIVVAGGIGIAPLFELLVQLASGQPGRSPQKTHLFYGARTASEFLPEALFDGLNLALHWSTDDGSRGFHGFVTQDLRQTAETENLNPTAIYACGPLAMQYHVAQWAMEREVPAQLSLESLMACGLGACLGCALPARGPNGPQTDHYVHVCKDGPIFSAGAIQWQRIQTQQIPLSTFLCS